VHELISAPPDDRPVDLVVLEFPLRVVGNREGRLRRNFAGKEKCGGKKKEAGNAHPLIKTTLPLKVNPPLT
jgi:hypothetical protein